MPEAVRERRRGQALLLTVLLSSAVPALAGEILVTGADGPGGLQAAIDRAVSGDTIRVRGGRYAGPLRVDRSVSILGVDRPVIDGGSVGSVVDLGAEGTTFRGFLVRGSGTSLDEENSGIAVRAANVAVEDNVLEDVLFGIYLRQAPGGMLRGNRIHGMDLDLARRGDAIRVWYSDGVTLEANVVSQSRDVVLWYSNRLDIRDNAIRRGRYGLHFMYCDDALIQGNLLADNSVGAFLMYSRRLRLEGNTITGNRGPSGYGVGLKDMDDAVLSRNNIAGNRVGVFLDNSPRDLGSVSLISGNVLAANDFGVALLPNVRRASFLGNGFLENQEQVGIAGPGGDPAANDWEGNYWSDYAGYDADGDGRGDLPYRAERLFENLADRNPRLRLFLYSPASEALDFAARAFPLVRPRPKLEDPVPSLAKPVVVTHPLVARPARRGLLVAALGMLIAAQLLVAMPGRWARRRSRPRASRQEELMIEVEGLSKRYGAHVALDDVTFTVPRGGSLALWGANGAGKTTALRALLGVVPCEGRVRLDGLDPARQGKQARGRVGFIPQEIPLQGDLRVGETLDFYSRLRRCGGRRAGQLLAELGLAPHTDKQVRHLSGGLRQRLALALALLGDPPVLLLDEPSANLDEAARRGFIDVLSRLRGDKTIIFTTHRSGEVFALADQVLVLEAGRVVGVGSPAEMLAGAGREGLRLVGGELAAGGGGGATA